MKISAHMVASIVATLTIVSSHGHSSARPAESIRAHHARINRELPRYTRVHTDLTGYSTEGGTLTAYFHGPSLRKMVARHYGETGKAIEEYYFWNNRLFFVFRRDYDYDKPFGRVKRTTENRYSFSQGKLVRWVNKNSKQVSTTSPQAQEREREFLRSAREFLSLARAARAKRV